MIFGVVISVKLRSNRKLRIAFNASPLIPKIASFRLERKSKAKSQPATDK